MGLAITEGRHAHLPQKAYFVLFLGVDTGNKGGEVSRITAVPLKKKKAESGLFQKLSTVARTDEAINNFLKNPEKVSIFKGSDSQGKFLLKNWLDITL